MPSTRHVLVTGASRGIGLEFVRQCLTRGDHVYAACRNPDSANKLHAAAQSARAFDRLHVVPLDVSDQTSIDTSYAVVRRHTDTLDLLINNAGILYETDSLVDNLESLNFERMGQVFATNAFGAVLMARRYLDLLARSTDAKSPARIANVTSEYGSIQLHTHTDTYAYSASKAALNMFTRILAHDRATRGMIVLTIDPGWVRTDMGGDDASLSPSESVGGMLRVIDRATAADTGRFFRWDGADMPW